MKACEACGQSLPILRPCGNCTHPAAEHDIERKQQPCSRGAGIPGLACGCRSYEENR